MTIVSTFNASDKNTPNKGHVEIPDWSKLYILYVVALAGSLSKAAPIVGVTQSCLSRHMDTLEKKIIGMSLFRRNVKGLYIMQFAVPVLEEVKLIMQIKQKIEEIIKKYTGYDVCILNLDKLRIFLEIAEKGSLNAAATPARVSQSCLSRHIKNFEKLIGIPLFIRHVGGLIPTDISKEILPLVKEIKQRVVNIENILTNVPQAERVFALSHGAMDL